MSSINDGRRHHFLRPPSVDAGNDPGLKRFLRDAKALKTKVEYKWTAWLDDRCDGDGIVGTGETEVEAIKNLAAAYKNR